MKKILLLAFFIFYCQVWAQAPNNDDCVNAIPLTVSTDLSCTSKISGTLVGATNSGLSTYNNGRPDDDVWYSFVATASNNKISLLNIAGSSTNLIREIAKGNCEQLTIIGSYDYVDSGIISGLTVGMTYYIRVFSNETVPVSSTFDLCVTSLLDLTNDNCVDTISLTVNTDLSCTSKTSGTVIGATNSGFASATGAADDDVWFSFVATSTSHRISLLNIVGNHTSLVHEVMEVNSTCKPTTTLKSTTSKISIVSGLIVGNTYHIRVFSLDSYPILTIFDICVSTMPQLTNDECVDAIPLTVNANASCAITTPGTLLGATNSGIESTVGHADDDVWYRFEATANSHTIRLLNIEGDIRDFVHQVFQGTCNGELVSVAISDPNSSILTGLAVGSTYYVRVYSYRELPTESTTFYICIDTPPVLANDNCLDAIVVQVNTDGSCALKTTGSLVGATDSPEGNNGVGTPDDDVWYSFVATATSHIIKLLNIQGDITDLVHEVMQGNCGGQLASLSISDPDSSVISGLTVGSMYYVRIFSKDTARPETTSFELCISTHLPAPANDECAGAIALTVNPGLLCGTTTSGTVVGATDSGINAQTGTADDDVWYSFVATATSHQIRLINIRGDQMHLVHEVISGTCGQSTVIHSSIFPSSTVSELTVGTTYYIRVFTHGRILSESTTFNICVGTLLPPPANDECAGAIALTVNADTNCGAITSGTLVGATDSGVRSYQRTPDDDVWYSFVATKTHHKISLTNVRGDQIDLVHDVMSGACGQLTIIYSEDFNYSTVSGLTVGTTYYIRVFTYENIKPASTTFDICVGTFPPTPANDECTDAIALVPATSYAAGAVNSTVFGATSTDAFSLPPCGLYRDNRGGDVWYTAVIPADGKLTIETGNPTNSNDTTFDSVLAVYTGTCNDFTLIACNDDASGDYSRINLTERTAGETVYIRVWESDNDEEELFSISAWSPTLGVSTFNDMNFKAYPNPVTNILNLSHDQNISDVQIYNLLGQNVASESINNTSTPIDMSGLPSGSYLVKVTAEGQTKTIKVIKQ